MRKEKHHGEHGSTIFETMTALLILSLVFFSMLQIYQWCVNKLFTEYSAFYATRGMALGYHFNLAQRAARVAAIGISGRRIGYSQTDELSAARKYMSEGDNSAISYEYWDWRGTDKPFLNFSGYYDTLEDGNQTVTGHVQLENSRLLAPSFSKLLGIEENPECRSTVTNLNYSKLYLEE